jgi:hypothetical protein
MSLGPCGRRESRPAPVMVPPRTPTNPTSSARASPLQTPPGALPCPFVHASEKAVTRGSRRCRRRVTLAHACNGHASPIPWWNQPCATQTRATSPRYACAASVEATLCFLETVEDEHFNRVCRTTDEVVPIVVRLEWREHVVRDVARIAATRATDTDPQP